ncbi:MAG TPA: hypothetical protein PJ990_07490 [Saprospiraceae bacterium]|nr:hypothetical protein [Saprospiraceae bacterium]
MKTYCLTIILIVIQIVGCKQNSEVKRIAFRETIKSVRNDITDLTWIEAPLTRPQAKPILESPELYLDSMILMLRDKNDDLLEKEIGLVLMDNLSKISKMQLTDSIYMQLDKQTLTYWIDGIYTKCKLLDKTSKKRREYLNYQNDF